MATGSGKPQLPRRLSTAVLAALRVVATLAANQARAQYEASGYAPIAGEPFFLLADKSFASNQPAEVRLEAGQAYGLTQIEANGGVDVVLYRVPQPIEFLKQQRNLHRVRVDGVPRPEGLANTLSHLWDRWYLASRVAWRKIFSPEARKSVTAEAPELRAAPAIFRETEFQHPPQWAPLAGFDLVARFRYPVHHAQPIQPPKGVALAGSSSDFTPATTGNVMVPLGRLQPGLYLVEAYVGAFRANTLLFVSDTVAVTKASAGELLVWTAKRGDGTAVPGVRLAWSDGTGLLKSGVTDKAGLARLPHKSPERSYLFGSDPQGGVLIAESFYYDSEIYDAKLYAVTDRPLYRPGDQVFVKFLGRRFQSARLSSPLAAGPLALTVFDPNGAPVATQKLNLAPDRGGDTSFLLPENATGGGYELRFAYGDNTYSAAFRVAEYQKPHFEIGVAPDKPDFKTNEPIGSLLQLRYPDGKPVQSADVQVSVRAQQLTLVDGELGYYGQFPVKLTSESLRTDAKGDVRLELPPAEQPSRYVITVTATDGAAYRVKTTRELLVERGTGSYSLRAERQWSAPGENVAFTIASVVAAGSAPASWEWVRLEDRATQQGPLAAAGRLDLRFAASGSYTVQLRDLAGSIVGGTHHYVSGGGVKPPAGAISLVPSREACLPGETVELLISFSEPVDEALLTLERDNVEQATLLRSARGWVQTKRIAPTQWLAKLQVRADFAPNVTFSVAYVKNGEYVFQNQGLRVAQPRVDIEFRPAKQEYLPGERVNVDVLTTIGGKPAAALLVVSVVDELIYALQPELAPSLDEFLYHPRRNNVRTSSSLSFIGYDLASSRAKGAPERRSVSERRVKALERPRREDVDTAFWDPALKTDGSGRARFSFAMPDSLTRWRLTGRALTADGTAGQRRAFVRSSRELYVKWTSPDWMRQGDAPNATIALFNQTDRDQKVELRVSGGGLDRKEPLTLKPGVSFATQPLAALQAHGRLQVALLRDGRQVDALDTRFERLPAGWRSPRTATVELAAPVTPLSLPADARHLRLVIGSSSADQFGRVIDDLLEYPYGCVEQTASRMIPFALALESLPPEAVLVRDRLRQQLNGQRLRLAYMAGPKAGFAWWGAHTSEDPLLTAYAYFADSLAVKALGLELPTEHWNRLLDVYANGGHALPPAQRALMLEFMSELGLPVKGLAEGLLADLRRRPIEAIAPQHFAATASTLLGEPESPLAEAIGTVLAGRLAQVLGVPVPKEVGARMDAAYALLDRSDLPLAETLLVRMGLRPKADAATLLRSVSAEMPTLERALTLVWLDRALGEKRTGLRSTVALDAPWERVTTSSGGVEWRWPAGQALPTELRLATAPAANTVATLHYDSASAERGELPATLVRTLYRVNMSGAGFALEPVAPGAAFSTGVLYLDELRLTAKGKPLRHVLVEAPLPPGTSVESTTWGVNLAVGGGKYEPLEKARHQATREGYVVPADPVSGTVALRHLVRFAQKGRFNLPPSRAYRMYQPDAKAFDSASTRTLEVR